MSSNGIDPIPRRRVSSRLLKSLREAEKGDAPQDLGGESGGKFGLELAVLNQQPFEPLQTEAERRIAAVRKVAHDVVHNLNPTELAYFCYWFNSEVRNRYGNPANPGSTQQGEFELSSLRRFWDALDTHFPDLKVKIEELGVGLLGLLIEKLDLDSLLEKK